MKYIFVEESWEDYLYWQAHDKKMLQRINALLRDISRTPYSGLGKPEPLRYQYQGYWLRRITQEHRLIYKITGEEIWIAKCRHHYEI